MTVFVKNLTYTVNNNPIVGSPQGGYGNTIVDLDGFAVEISTYNESQEAIMIELAVYHEDQEDIDIGVIANTLLPISSLTSSSNTYQPTLAINGNIIASHIETNPGNTVLANTRFYIQWLDTAITGASWKDLSNFGFTLNKAGGDWSLTSRIPLFADGGGGGVTFGDHMNGPSGPRSPTPMSSLSTSNLGQAAEIFGFRGSTTEFGPKVSDNEVGWRSKGIFGSAILNRDMAFLTFGSTSILTNQFFESIITKNETIVSFAHKFVQVVNGIATGLAETHINLTWRAVDVPMVDTFKVDGLSVIGALNKLAGMVGAELRWNGKDDYLVTYPNVSIGTFEVADPKLLQPAGLEYVQILDLETGLSKVGTFLIPVDSQTIEEKELPDASAPPMEMVWQTKTRMDQVISPIDNLTDVSVPAIVNLAQDYDKVYIQVLVGPDASTSGTVPVSLQNWITKTPSEFFEFNVATLSGTVPAGTYKNSLGQDIPGYPKQTSYIFNREQGGTFIPTLAIDWKLFTRRDDNGAIDTGNFTMTFMQTRKTLRDLFIDQAKKQADQIKRNILNAFEPSKFVKVYSGTFSFQFYGVMPTPGMWGKCTVPDGATLYTLDSNGNTVTTRIPDGDMTVEGVIESVQFSFPGVVTLNVVQYARIDYSKVGNRAMTVPIIGIPG